MLAQLGGSHKLINERERHLEQEARLSMRRFSWLTFLGRNESCGTCLTRHIIQPFPDCPAGYDDREVSKAHESLGRDPQCDCRPIVRRDFHAPSRHDVLDPWCIMAGEQSLSCVPTFTDDSCIGAIRRGVTPMKELTHFPAARSSGKKTDRKKANRG
jgi:hypothetical protein